MTARALGIGMLALAAACAPRSPGADAASDVSSSPPVLTRVQPDTIALGRGAVPTLVLTGSGFAPGGAAAFTGGENTLLIGRATFDRVSADSLGRTITFALPLVYVDTTLKGRPASFTPGTYPVSVRTSHGVSNTLSLIMRP